MEGIGVWVPDPKEKDSSVLCALAGWGQRCILGASRGWRAIWGARARSLILLLALRKWMARWGLLE